MNARCAPARVVATDHSDQIPNFVRDAGPAGLATADTPRPEQAKAFAMPSQDRFRLHDHQRLIPARPNALELHPECPVRLCKPESFRRRSPENSELLPQGEVLQTEFGGGFEPRGNGRKQRRRSMSNGQKQPFKTGQVQSSQSVRKFFGGTI